VAGCLTPAPVLAPVAPVAALTTPAPPTPQPAPPKPPAPVLLGPADVDRMVQALWEAAGVDPAPPAEDAEFLRRVTLDAIGRVPTLAEALAVCKGVCHVDIELKDYGKSQRLEERVVEVVEAAGMQNDIVTMSLNRRMVENMKRLRPGWTSGLLAAKAIGQPNRLPVDFLAVESRTATRSFIRAAHAARKPVYVWTVNDPQRMIRMIGLGADGLITDRPALAREVVRRYADMPQPERLLLFAMTRLGVREEISEPEDNLRP